jgi:hypothetical protein
VDYFDIRAIIIMTVNYSIFFLGLIALDEKYQIEDTEAGTRDKVVPVTDFGKVFRQSIKTSNLLRISI